MPSDHTEELFKKLGVIAKDVENALLIQDYQGIEALVSDHLSIMNLLSRSETLDTSLKPVIEETHMQVQTLMSKIQGMQEEIKTQLSTMNKKKLIHSAYHV